MTPRRTLFAGSRRSAAALLLAGAFYAPAYAPAAFGQSVTIVAGGQQHSADLATVERLPAVTEHIAFVTSHGTEQADFTGALLWRVLDQEGALGSDPRARLRHTILVTGRDGYAAALAVAEIDPEFEGKQVLLADRRNGQALPQGELRLVVPGDHRGGRSVRDVVRIEVR